MDSKPLISVIVPIYRVEQYLDRCIESIITQTYDNLEIILVDDGSPDKCPQICDEWATKDNRIKVIHKMNGGLSDARNAGMEIASGDYISFIDSDDWIADRMIEKLIESIVINHTDISACGVEMVWDDDRPSQRFISQPECVLDKIEAQRALLKESILKQPVWYKLYKRAPIIDIPFEKGKYHEDIFWSYQAIGNANAVSIVDYVGYYYWQRSDSIMGEGYSLKRLDAVEAKERRQRYLNKYFPELVVIGQEDLLFTCLYHGQLVLRKLSGDSKKVAISRLKSIYLKNTCILRFNKEDSISHRIWLIMGKYMFKTTCMLRNLCGVGK